MERTHFISRAGLATLAALLALTAFATAQASAAAPKSFFGINATLPTDGDYKRMGKAGFGAYRFDMNWAGIQTKRKGGYDWNGPDAAVRHAATNGMQPVPLLIGTPKFVKKNADGLYPPTKEKEDRQAWQSFAGEAAKRYGPGGVFWSQNPDVPEIPIKKWLVWNEQNAAAFWKPRPNPRDYATLVKLTDRGISQEQPQAKISLGGMFGYPQNDSSPTAVNFLRKFYAVNGIEKHFEAIAVHPYGSGVSTVKTQIEEARKAAKRAGDRNVGIIVGELGWASNGPKSAEEVVGSKGQANRLKKGLNLLANKRRSWNIENVFVYVWRDFPPELTACLWCPKAGLLKENGDEKPAFKAVRKVLKGG